MVFIDFRTVVVLIMSAFLLAVCGFILVVEPIYQAEKKRRQDRGKRR